MVASIAGQVAKITREFVLPGALIESEPLRGGHINDSWRLTVSDGSSRQRFLLQHLNGHVFPKPQLVMENMSRITEHLARVVPATGPDPFRNLTLVPTSGGRWWYTDDDGSCWRVFPFIEGTVSREMAASTHDAYEAARAFGRFQRWLGGYDGPRLHEVIKGFHDTPARLAALRVAIERDSQARRSIAESEIERILANAGLASGLLNLCQREEIPERVVHNDAKIENVLFDAVTGRAVCIVDLDTVMPGLSLYDFGDMARSMACPSAEDATDLDGVAVDVDLFESLARGYLDGAGDLISQVERASLVTAAQVITYEQSVRFLADFLDGDTYYRTTRPQQNLDRCRVQLTLLESLIATEAELNQRLGIS